MQSLDYLEAGKYYPIYNRGINSCDLFTEEDNYAYFLSLYEKYIEPITDTEVTPKNWTVKKYIN